MIAALIATAAGGAAADGLWRTPGPRGIVRIERCADQLCGETYDPSKPDALGTPLLSGFVGGPSLWTRGTITDPRTHHVYAGRLRLRDPSSLEVTGCLAIALCGHQVWTRWVP